MEPLNGRTVVLAFIVYAINVPAALWLAVHGYYIPSAIVVTLGSVIIWLIAAGKIRA